MIAELGRRLLHFTMAVALLSSILVPAMTVLGVPPPESVLRYTGILGLVTGQATVENLVNLAADIGMGVSALALTAVISRLFGNITVTQALGLKALAMYLALWLPAADGVTVVSATLAQAATSILPGTVAGAAYALANAFNAVARFAILYYLATRALGLPSE